MEEREKEREPHCRSLGCRRVERCALLAAYAVETRHPRLPYRCPSHGRRMGHPTQGSPCSRRATTHRGPEAVPDEIRAPEVIRGPVGWQWRRRERKGRESHCRSLGCHEVGRCAASPPSGMRHPNHRVLTRRRHENRGMGPKTQEPRRRQGTSLCSTSTRCALGVGGSVRNPADRAVAPCAASCAPP